MDLKIKLHGLLIWIWIFTFTYQLIKGCLKSKTKIIEKTKNIIRTDKQNIYSIGFFYFNLILICQNIPDVRRWPKLLSDPSF